MTQIQLISQPGSYLQTAQNTMRLEAHAVLTALTRLNDNIHHAVEWIVNHPGKVIVTGMGKSGHIGQKIAATLCGTGTPAVFLHPAEALHGDLGVCVSGDTVLMISNSGCTQELVRLLPELKALGCKVIAIAGNLNSPLSRQVDILFDARVEQEADPLGLAPTSSAIVALALGDALASALMHARGFSTSDFARIHPKGQLGRSLLLKVADVMHPLHQTAHVELHTDFKSVIITMCEFNLGAACVLSMDNILTGIITDGDIRRTLKNYDDIRHLKAENVMTINPLYAYPDWMLSEALQIMENRPSQISVLPVVEPGSNKCLGLIRIHDIYQPEYR